MAQSGGRAARCLHDLLGRPAPVVSLQPIDFLVALTVVVTLVEPMRSLMLVAIDAERSPVRAVSVTPGSGGRRGRMRTGDLCMRR
jgi:microcystin degradation protein MlrC